MDPNRMSFGSLGHPAAVPATPGLVATALVQATPLAAYGTVPHATPTNAALTASTGQWKQVTDPSSGRKVYVNSSTGTVQSTAPPGASIQKIPTVAAAAPPKTASQLRADAAAKAVAQEEARADAEDADVGASDVTDTFADYEPRHLRLGIRHPDSVVETSSMGAVPPPLVCRCRCRRRRRLWN